MYSCDRCGTRFGRPTTALGSCPRCLARDGVRVPLTFGLFEERRRTSRGGLEEAVREELSSTAPGSRRGATEPRRGVRDAA